MGHKGGNTGSHALLGSSTSAVSLPTTTGSGLPLVTHPAREGRSIRPMPVWLHSLCSPAVPCQGSWGPEGEDMANRGLNTIRG